MQSLIALFISFILIPIVSAEQKHSPRVLSAFASMLNIKSKAELESARDDLKRIDQLECFKENRFVMNEGILRVTIDPDSFEKYVYKVKPAGFLEMLFWGKHASDTYKSRISEDNFFNFPSSVWSVLKDGNVEMILSARSDKTKDMSHEEFKTRFIVQAKKLKDLVPGMKVECDKNTVHIEYARALVSLLDSPNCEELLSVR